MSKCIDVSNIDFMPKRLDSFRYFSSLCINHTKKSFFKSYLRHTDLDVFIQSFVLLPRGDRGGYEEDGHGALDAEFRDVGNFDKDLSLGR